MSKAPTGTPRAWISKLLLLTFLATFFSLGFLGTLQPIIEFLDSDRLAFQIDTMRFSVYFLAKSLLALAVLFWIARIFVELGERKIKNLQKLQAGNRALIAKAFQMIVYFIAFLIALNIVGIDLTALALVGGAVGLGVGFGLQKIASNFISGLILLIEKSVQEGDMIELDDGTAGFIKRTHARYTLVETFEGRELMVPNEDFIVSRVSNWTLNNKLGRVEIPIAVAYGTDLEKAHDLILAAAKEHPRCAAKPLAECFLVDFGDSAVNFKLYFWVDDVALGRARPKSDVLFSIWRQFHEHNIKIPFPQRDIYMHQPPSAI